MICLGLLMFKVDMRHKLAILIFAALCLTCVQLSFMPFAKGAFGFLPFCFLLSILPHFSKYYREMKQTVVLPLMVLMIISAVVFAFTSPHMDTWYLKGKLVYNELMQKTFIMAFVMFCIKGEKDLKPTMKWAFVGLLILTALGVLNYMAKQSFWVSAVRSENFGKDAGAMYMYSDRFRVQSMFGLAFDYGYTCILFAMLFFYALKKKLVSKNVYLIAEACCLFGVYTCGCRSVHVAYLLAIAVYAISAFDMRKWVFVGVIAGMAAILILPNIPAFQKYMDLFEQALNTSTVNMSGGSTIGMRLLQLSAVFFYLRGHMLFGRGKDFFQEDLGWAEKTATGTGNVDKDLYGLEGVYLGYLLERGIFGYICYLIFYVVLFFSAFKMRKADPISFGLFASAIAAYFFYANATGELGSVAPTMLMMGIALKMLYVNSGKIVYNKL